MSFVFFVVKMNLEVLEWLKEKFVMNSVEIKDKPQVYKRNKINLCKV